MSAAERSGGDTARHVWSLAALTRGRDSARRAKISKIFKLVCRFFLQCISSAPMCGSPKFARACGRVSIGRHPDKRPDSRLRLVLQPHYVIGSRRRNRRTPRSTGDAA